METSVSKVNSENENMTSSNNLQQNLMDGKNIHQQTEFENIVENLKISGDPELVSIGAACSEYLDSEQKSKGELQFSCGGLQNFLDVKKRSTTKFDNNTNSNSCEVKISSLPDTVLLFIFSFLDAITLCKASRVSTKWNILGNDEILWKKKLEKDVKDWCRICYITNPDTYQECMSTAKAKDIYLNCCPDYYNARRKQIFRRYCLSSFLNLTVGIPNIAIFGPGLDSAVGIELRLISDDNGEFSVLGFTPSEFYGIGSGVLLQIGGKKMNFMTLHGNSAKIRKSEDRERHNKMIDINEDTQEYVLKPDFQNLCRIISGFVFAVEGNIETASSVKMEQWRKELFAMVSEKWVVSSVPVVIMSCTRQCSEKHRPAIEIVRGLHLAELKRPWLIQNVTVENLSGAAEAMKWIFRRY